MRQRLQARCRRGQHLPRPLSAIEPPPNGDSRHGEGAAVTVAELPVGVRLAFGKRRNARQVYVDVILESVPIIAYDREVAVGHAELLVAVRGQGSPRCAHDLLIAATARARGR